MGLPLWRAPSPPPSKDTAKPTLDATSASRSSIRRRRSSRSPLRRAAALQRIAAQEAQFAASERRAQDGTPSFTLRSPGPPPRTLTRAATEDFAIQAELERRYPNLPPPVPSVPEIRSFRRSRSPQHDHDYTSRYETRPAEYMNPASLRLMSSRSDRSLPLTPDFAPARPSTRPSGELLVPSELFVREDQLARIRSLQQRQRALRDTHNELLGEIVTMDRRSGASHRRSQPDGPLRASNLRDAWSPATTIDGLGDRRRSISPVEEGWDTMRETIQPDQQLPSAESSFASAAASASFSNSNATSRSGSANSISATSARTHLTVPTPNEEDPVPVICDSSDDSDAEYERGMLSHLRSTRDRARPHEVSRYQHRVARRTSRVHDHDEAHPSIPPRHARMSGSNFIHPLRRPNPFRTRREDWRSHRHRDEVEMPSTEYEYPFLGTPERDTEATAAPSYMEDSDLEQLRPLLERVARRGNIPENFWLSVGLAPVIAQNVDRTTNAATGEDRS